MGTPDLVPQQANANRRKAASSELQVVVRWDLTDLVHQIRDLNEGLQSNYFRRPWMETSFLGLAV
jgi:hypothetical protein